MNISLERKHNKSKNRHISASIEYRVLVRIANEYFFEGGVEMEATIERSIYLLGVRG